MTPDPVTPDAGTTTKTVGVDPKVPIQAVVTIVAWLLAYFGVDLSPEVSSAIALVLGALAAVVGPAAKTVVRGSSYGTG